MCEGIRHNDSLDLFLAKRILVEYNIEVRLIQSEYMSIIWVRRREFWIEQLVLAESLIRRHSTLV